MQKSVIKGLIASIPVVGAAIFTALAGSNGDWVGWIFFVIFCGMEIFVLEMVRFEIDSQFYVRLEKINSLDLTCKRDIPRNTRGKYRLSDRVCAQFAWLARHRN